MAPGTAAPHPLAVLLLCMSFWIMAAVLAIAAIRGVYWLLESLRVGGPRRRVRVRRRLLACGSIEVRECHSDADAGDEEVCSIVSPARARELVQHWLPARYVVIDDGWDTPEVEHIGAEGLFR